MSPPKRAGSAAWLICLSFIIEAGRVQIVQLCSGKSTGRILNSGASQSRCVCCYSEMADNSPEVTGGVKVSLWRCQTAEQRHPRRSERTTERNEKRERGEKGKEGGIRRNETRQEEIGQEIRQRCGRACAITDQHLHIQSYVTVTRFCKTTGVM